MYKHVPDSPLTPDFPAAQAAFDCRATAALLRSLRTLEWASHLGAVLAISGFKWFLLLPWAIVVYCAVRVRLDAELLDLLALDPQSAPGILDEWLSRAGLRAPSDPRSIGDRCKGARRLALYLVCAFILQCAATALAFWSWKP